MKHTTLRNALVTLSSFIFVVGIVTAWTGPSANPPGSNTDAPINASSSAQVKLGALGVGALDSAGSVRIGTTATACSVLNGGAIRWVDASLGFEYCNKTAWVPFGGGGSTVSGNCADGEFMTGITIDGNIICSSISDQVSISTASLVVGSGGGTATASCLGTKKLIKGQGRLYQQSADVTFVPGVTYGACTACSESQTASSYSLQCFAVGKSTCTFYAIATCG